MIIYTPNTISYPEPFPPLPNHEPSRGCSDWDAWRSYQPYLFSSSPQPRTERIIALEIGGDSCAVSMMDNAQVTSEIGIARESRAKVDISGKGRIEVSLGLEFVAAPDQLVRKTYNFDLTTCHEMTLEPDSSEMYRSKSSSRGKKSKKITERKRAKKSE